MLAGEPNFRAAADAVRRQAAVGVSPPALSTPPNPVLRLAECPGQAAGHAISWACRSGSSRPLRTRIVDALDDVDGHLPAGDEVWLCLGVPTSPADAKSRRGVAGCLTEQELNRTRAFRFSADAWSYAAAHSLLRTLLGRMLRRAPLALRFDVSEAGKPHLSAGAGPQDLHFNLSHSRGLVAVAVARHPVGVDVERVRPLPDMRELLAELMADGVLSQFDNTSPDERTALFYRYWTLAEAFVKANGEGLGGALANLAFTSRGIPRLMPEAESGRPELWHFGHANGAVVDWQCAGRGEPE